MAYTDDAQKFYQNNYSTTRSTDNGHVFGTYTNGNVTYDVSEFERKREDGTTIIDLTPECRVFIFGAEVTQDIQNVSIRNSVEGNHCTIQLSNPRGKYEISKADLLKNWREDKDILSCYTYEYLQKRVGINKDLLQVLSANPFMQRGTIGGKNGIKIMDVVQQTMKFFTAGTYGTPSPFNVTRMAFETKFFSGIDKRVGDFVFDFRDPVMVFMKGRFSPYWYFAFTGVLVSWDSNDVYGQEQSISLKCEDLLLLLKRHKFTKQGSLVNGGNWEASSRNIHSKNKSNIWETSYNAPNTPLDDAVKILFYGTDYYNKIENCFPLSSKKGNTNIPPEKIDEVRNFLEKNYKIGKTLSSELLESDFMLTYGVNDNWTDFDGTPRAGHLINISNITGIQSFSGDNPGSLNTLPYSQWLNLYPQFNKIELSTFDGRELQYRYDASVRFWETRPTLPAEKLSDESKSGWTDSDAKALGAAGIHPAMTYEFINNFDMLHYVWAQCWKVDSGQVSANIDILDNLNTSPHEKIREIVTGSPTEVREDNESAKGSNANLFRPRLFMVIPNKFKDRNRSVGQTLMGQLRALNDNATSTYQALSELCQSVEFNFYCSPMGDIFIEPPLYDLHPLDFFVPKDTSDKSNPGKIETRPIYKKKKKITFRATNSENYGSGKQYREDYAYMYDTDANHPFFIMEKDRIKQSQSFKPENIKTHISVQGSVTGMGSITDTYLLQYAEKLSALTSLNETIEDGGFATGEYVADGFGFKINRNADNPFLYDKQAKEEEELYKTNVVDQLGIDYLNSKFKAIMEDSADKMIELCNNDTFITNHLYWRPDLVQLVQLSILEDGAETKSLKYGLNISPVGELILKDLAPILMNLFEYGTKASVQGALYQSEIENHPTITPSTSLKSLTQPVYNKKQSQIATVEGMSLSRSLNRSDLAFGSLGSQQFFKEIFNLFEPIGLQKYQIFVKSIETIQETKDMAGLNYPPSTMFTPADLKLLEKEGIYDPRTDMTRRYGYNQGPSITNLMIDNGDEARRYAMTIFNRLFGQAYAINMDIIGRPEFVLNRPYYCEGKDSIGLLEYYTLNFSIGTDFISNAELTYIRKNALTYDYTLDNMDVLASEDVTNSYFAEAAKEYYKSMSPINQQKSIGSLLDRGRQAAGTQLGTTVAKKAGANADIQQIAGDIGQTVLSAEGSNFYGAIYTAHDWIGHMEYDRTGLNAKITKRAIVKAIGDSKIKDLIGESVTEEFVAEQVYNVCNQIDLSIKSIRTLEQDMDLKSDEQNKTSKEVTDLTNQLTQQTNSTVGASLKVQNLSSKLEKTKIALDSIKAELESYAKQHKELSLTLYGIEGNYVPDGTTKSNSPSKDRIPSINTLQNATSFIEKGTTDSLYYTLYDTIVNTCKVDPTRVELIDDRNLTKAYKFARQNQDDLPFYAKIKPDNGNS